VFFSVSGVARAFNEPLHLHPELVEIVKKLFHADTGAPMKFAKVSRFETDIETNKTS
jgi:molybdopterin-biosynthesis enzyme MoeA-like protein